MISVELRIMLNGHDTSLEEIAGAVADQILRRIEREIPKLLDVHRIEEGKQHTPPAQNEPKAVTIQEAARLLSVSVAGLHKFIREKRLRAIHVGRRVVIPMEVIRNALQNGVPKKPTL